MSINILAVSGSMRAGSHGAQALNLVLEAAREHGAQTRLLDLREADLPMFRPGAAVETEAVRQALDHVAWADAFVLGTPDYHGSMSGAMKNFLDFHWKEFAGKLFAYLCTSHEHGATPMEQMRTAVRQCYGWSLPFGVAFNSGEVFDNEGRLTDARLASRLRMTARDLTVYGTLLRRQFQSDLQSADADTFAAHYRK